MQTKKKGVSWWVIMAGLVGMMGCEQEELLFSDLFSNNGNGENETDNGWASDDDTATQTETEYELETDSATEDEFPFAYCHPSDIYGLTSDRVAVWPDVQYPTDPLSESDYVPMELGEQVNYLIEISEDWQTLSFEDSCITGTLQEATLKTLYYNLDPCDELPNGGRFRIWLPDETVETQQEGEFTRYGSGAPIIRSERGSIFISII